MGEVGPRQSDGTWIGKGNKVGQQGLEDHEKGFASVLRAVASRGSGQ